MRLGVIAAFVAIAWCVVTLDLLGPATIDPDASSSVLYFDRIVSGHRLEGFVPTTPKPLLTVVFGVSWGLAHDWRLLTWETVLAWGLAVGATTAFVARVAARVAVPRFTRSAAPGSGRFAMTRPRRAADSGPPADRSSGATPPGTDAPPGADAPPGMDASSVFAPPGADGSSAVVPPGAPDAAAPGAVAAQGAPRAAAAAAAAGILAAVAGASFTTAALIGSSDLMLEVSRANSLVWALAGWSIAGLAVTARPMRPRLAGGALLLAGLCRFETLALAAVAVIAVALWQRTAPGAESTLVPGIAETAEQTQARTAAVRARTRTSAIVGAFLAVFAIVLALVHDWLLTGDPLYWLSVPSRYTALFNPGLESIGPLAFAGTLFGRLAPEWPLIVLAAVGVAALIRARAWLPLAGIAAVGLGEIALLFWLAFRATYISNRYYEPIALALIVAAGIGVGWLASRFPVARLEPGRLGTEHPQAGQLAAAHPQAGHLAAAHPQPGHTAAGLPPAAHLGAGRRAIAAVMATAAVAAIAGIAVTWPALPWDRRATTELADVRRAAAHLATVRPSLEESLAAGVTQLLVPSRDVSRVSVETGESLDRIVNSYAVLLNRGVKGLEPGQVVFHDAAADRPVALYRPLEVDPEASVGGNTIVRLEPRLAEIWLLSVR